MEIKWSAPEYHYYPKDVGWYWFVIIAAMAVVVLALWQRNFLFAVFSVIASILILSWGRRPPRQIDFTLSEKGLDIEGKKFYPFENLAGFAIIQNPDNAELSELILQTKNRVGTWVRVIIANQRAEDIKKLLLKFIPEIEYTESMTEHIGRILRF